MTSFLWGFFSIIPASELFIGSGSLLCFTLVPEGVFDNPGEDECSSFLIFIKSSKKPFTADILHVNNIFFTVEE